MFISHPLIFLTSSQPNHKLFFHKWKHKIVQQNINQHKNHEFTYQAKNHKISSAHTNLRPQHFLTRCKPLNNQICNGWKICEIQPFFQVKIWSHATETTKKTQGVWKFEGKKPGSVHLFVLPSFDRSRWVWNANDCIEITNHFRDLYLGKKMKEPFRKYLDG